MVIPDTPLFEGVRSSNDVLSMDRTKLEGRKFGIFQGTPGADWVVKNGFAGQMHQLEMPAPKCADFVPPNQNGSDFVPLTNVTEHSLSSQS